jgi:hypothetical protein
MASWAWKCARGGVGGERKWGWLLGGVVLAGHAAAVCPRYISRVPLMSRWYWLHGRFVISSRGLWPWLPITFPRLGILSCSSLCVIHSLYMIILTFRRFFSSWDVSGQQQRGEAINSGFAVVRFPPSPRAHLMYRYIRSNSLGDTLHQCPGHRSQEGR